MAVEANYPDPLFDEPPFEECGVVIIETDDKSKKIFYFPPLTQKEIDALALAQSDRSFLESKQMQGLNLARVIYANTSLPGGHGLLNRTNVIKQVDFALERMASILRGFDTPLNREKYRPIFGIAGYIKADLKPLTLSKRLPEAA